MTAAPEFILGFDPGGQKAFGWSVCKRDRDGRLCRVETGVVSNAEEALCAVKGKVGASRVLATGIDAPLLWSKKGNREIDRKIRCELSEKCFETRCRKRSKRQVHETVQHINSLRGACTVQGVLLAKYLSEEHPHAKITETHPKALSFLLRCECECSKEHECQDECRELCRLLEATLDKKKVEEHQCGKEEPKRDRRDAVISAYAAWSMLNQLELKPHDRTWSNLYEQEPNPLRPFGTCVSYWMPITP